MAGNTTLEKVSEIAFTLFNIEARVSQLPGDTDENFMLETANGKKYILKISLPEEDPGYLDFQNEILKHIATKKTGLSLPRIIANTEGEFLSTITSEEGKKRKVRLLSWVEGRLWAKVNPKNKALRASLGEQSGKLTLALQDFDHSKAHREFDWNLANAHWTFQHLDRFQGKEKEIVAYFQQRFSEIRNIYQKLPKSVVHNDINDYNILVSEDLQHPVVTGIIDFGDAAYTQTINDLAIVLAYAIMDVPDPLQAATEIIKGYNSTFTFSDKELECLYALIGMRLITSVTKSSIRKEEDPTNKYHVISERPAWHLLEKWFAINEEFAYFSFRNSCGYHAHPNEDTFKSWTEKQQLIFSDLFPTEEKEEIQLLDLKVSSTWMGSQTEFNDLELFQFKIDQLQKEHPKKLIAGGYCEPRPLYTSTAYERQGNNGPESRTIHLGIDFWLPAGTPVHALFDAEIYTAVNDAGYKEYGGLVILKHYEDNITFYTLHGHLSVESAAKFNVGDPIKKGDCIGYLGTPKENGEWVPHLHFQLMLSMLDYTNDFPGVTYVNELPVWRSICPDPNILFKNKNLVTQYSKAKEDLLTFRKKHLGKSMSLSYDSPLHIVRGEGAYLLDSLGQKYLDTVNNVAHVGHEHPRVVAAGQRQMALLNTNTRYLHEEIITYTDAILKRLPKELSVLHIVNSGSEANELAIRMAKAFTGEKDMLAIEVGYHGNTNAVIDVSSYKFDGKGGKGKPETTHILPLPDPFRGKYEGSADGTKYAIHAKELIDSVKAKGKNIAGFIGEMMISCGGQIVPPANYYKEVYKHVRNSGGVCIADEVQTGFGRMGKSFWAFELFDVTPDIVTMGKPAGNGHPLALVACTPQIAEKFANGMEFFNTFGGNPVSCAIGRTVLEIIEEEKLQQNALEVGSFLKTQLEELQRIFPIVGDVRGEGLFLGFELTDVEKNPLPEHAAYLANRMKAFKILMSTDGPDHNVLKIKPPMVFSMENAKELIFRLKMVFAEDFMKHYWL